MSKQMLRKWLHEAAFAAGIFTGHAYWYELPEDRAVPAQRKAPAPSIDRDFGPALRAAD